MEAGSRSVDVCQVDIHFARPPFAQLITQSPGSISSCQLKLFLLGIFIFGTLYLNPEIYTYIRIRWQLETDYVVEARHLLCCALGRERVNGEAMSKAPKLKKSQRHYQPYQGGAGTGVSPSRCSALCSFDSCRLRLLLASVGRCGRPSWHGFPRHASRPRAQVRSAVLTDTSGWLDTNDSFYLAVCRRH